ncbi:hypothetical protein HDZ31DRAFT_69273 [Schizophyllum fasciatum]
MAQRTLREQEQRTRETATMSTFDLAAALAICAVSLLSALLFRVTQPDTQGIPIPEGSSPSRDNNAQNHEGAPGASLDPFAVTTPSDILEGFPVHEVAFWRRIRLRHLFIAALLAGSAAVDAAALTAELVAGAEGTVIASRVFNGLVALYLLSLSIIALSRSRGPSPDEDAALAPWLDRIALHEHVVLHQCGVGILASLLGAAVAIIPSYGSGFGDGNGAGSSDDIPFLAHLVLLALATALVMAVPMGPELYLPFTQIYDEKMTKDYEEKTADAESSAVVEPSSERTPLLPASKATSTPEPNVASVRTASLWSTLLFSYTTPVVWRGYNTLSSEDATFDIPDLPILPADMRATFNYSKMRAELARRVGGRRGGRANGEDSEGWFGRAFGWLKPSNLLSVPGLRLAYAVFHANSGALALESALAAVSACLFYVPAWMTRGLVKWLEDQERAADAIPALAMFANATMDAATNSTREAYSPMDIAAGATIGAVERSFSWTPYDSFAPVAPNATFGVSGFAGASNVTSGTGSASAYASAWLTAAFAPRTGDARWGWVWCAGLFASMAVTYMITAQLWSISTTVIQVRIKEQLNSVLFAKTLVRKDIAGGGGAEKKDAADGKVDAGKKAPSASSEDDAPNPEDDDFSSRAQVMTLMTTDVDRVSEFAWHLFSLIGALSCFF